MITKKPTAATPERGSFQSELIRGLVALAGFIAIVLAIRWSLGFLRDLSAPARTISAIYGFFGADRAAEAIAASGLGAASNKAIIALVSLVVGTVGVWALFIAANTLVDRLPDGWRHRMRPWVFVGPAMLLLTAFLVYPVFNTLYTSLAENIAPIASEVPEELRGEADVLAAVTALADRVTLDSYWVNSGSFEVGIATISSTRDGESRALLILAGERIRTIGLTNYIFAFGDSAMQIALRNNLIWLVVGTGGSVILGLLIAGLVDRVKREALAKTFIFLPLAISMVGAAVIWRFMYYWRPPGQSQIGLLNAIKTGLGGEPTAWIQTPPINTMALIVIMIWLQTGFVMVILSAALKGVPSEIIEAGRIDGASEPQLFFRVIIPSIRGSIITVSTTVFIAILKVFDIVFVMTGGRFDTEVVANRMFTEMFRFRNYGRASALAVILLVITIPIMVLNVRNLRRQGVGT